jgi:hypothetical protein
MAAPDPDAGMYFDEATKTMRIREVPPEEQRVPTLVDLIVRTLAIPLSPTETAEQARERLFKDENAATVADRIIADATNTHSQADWIFRQTMLEDEGFSTATYLQCIAAHAIVSNLEHPQTIADSEFVRSFDARFSFEIARFAVDYFWPTSRMDGVHDVGARRTLLIVRVASFLYFCLGHDAIDALLHIVHNYAADERARREGTIRPPSVDGVEQMIREVFFCIDTFWHGITEWQLLPYMPQYETIAHLDLVVARLRFPLSDPEFATSIHPLAVYLRRFAAAVDKTGPKISPADVFLDEQNDIYRHAIHSERYLTLDRLIAAVLERRQFDVDVTRDIQTSRNRVLRLLFFSIPRPAITGGGGTAKYAETAEMSWQRLIAEFFSSLVRHVQWLYLDGDPYRFDGYRPRTLDVAQLAAVIAGRIPKRPPAIGPFTRQMRRLARSTEETAVQVLQRAFGGKTTRSLASVPEYILHHFVPGGRPLEQQYTTATLEQHAEDAKIAGKWQRNHDARTVARFYFLLSDRTLFQVARYLLLPHTEKQQELMVDLLQMICADIVEATRSIYAMQLAALPPTPIPQMVAEDAVFNWAIDIFHIPLVGGYRSKINSLLRRSGDGNVPQIAEDDMEVVMDVFNELNQLTTPMQDSSANIDVILVLLLLLNQSDRQDCIDDMDGTTTERLHAMIKWALYALLVMHIADLPALVEAKRLRSPLRSDVPPAQKRPRQPSTEEDPSERPQRKAKAQALPTKARATDITIVCSWCERSIASDWSALRCSVCHRAWYCDVRCQRAHWMQGHRNACHCSTL